MPNPELSNVTLPNGITYDYKDAKARKDIEALTASTTNLGITTTPLTDGCTTNPIMVAGEAITAKVNQTATYGSKEFLYNAQGQWQEYGDLSGIGKLGWEDSAVGKFTPEGEITHELSKETVQVVKTQMVLPTYEVQGETLVIGAGEVPELEEKELVSDITSSTFTGTEGDITVTAPEQP